MSCNCDIADSILACPNCRRTLAREDDRLCCAKCGTVARVRDDVFDFVGSSSYAESFGHEWSRFRSTQLDSRNGTEISHLRFHEVTGWTEGELRDHCVLDAGSGSGRFSEVALAHGARVVALDLSGAAYITRKALGNSDSIVVRGDVLSPPLREEAFDKVFSIGVLQHTPDPVRAAQALLRLLRPGGEAAIWMYERRVYSRLLPKYVLRTVTRPLSTANVMRVANAAVTVFTPAARAAQHLPPRLGRLVRAALPVASYWGVLPLDPVQQTEWSRLDTFDWLSPTYDNPQTYEPMERALRACGAVSVARLDAPGLAIRAKKGL